MARPRKFDESDVIAAARDRFWSPATALLALMRGLEALRKGGVKPAQIKAAAGEALRLIPVR